MTMNDDQLNDLKQFIDSRISQSVENLASKDDIKTLASKDDIKRLEQKVDDGFSGVGEAVDEVNQALTNHEQRVTKLEAKIA